MHKQFFFVFRYVALFFVTLFCFGGTGGPDGGLVFWPCHHPDPRNSVAIRWPAGTSFQVRGQPAGIGAEIAMQVMEQAFDWLDAPIARVTGKDVPMPYAANLEALALPQIDDIVAVVRTTCDGFKG